MMYDLFGGNKVKEKIYIVKADVFSSALAPIESARGRESSTAAVKSVIVLCLL